MFGWLRRLFSSDPDPVDELIDEYFEAENERRLQLEDAFEDPWTIKQESGRIRRRVTAHFERSQPDARKAPSCGKRSRRPS